MIDQQNLEDEFAEVKVVMPYLPDVMEKEPRWAAAVGDIVGVMQAFKWG